MIYIHFFNLELLVITHHLHPQTPTHSHTHISFQHPIPTTTCYLLFKHTCTQTHMLTAIFFASELKIVKNE